MDRFDTIDNVKTRVGRKVSVHSIVIISSLHVVELIVLERFKNIYLVSDEDHISINTLIWGDVNKVSVPVEEGSSLLGDELAKV